MKPNTNHEFEGPGEDEGGKKPKRNRKAAFAKFKDEMLPQLKEEHPGLKHSQYMEMLHKMATPERLGLEN